MGSEAAVCQVTMGPNWASRTSHCSGLSKVFLCTWTLEFERLYQRCGIGYITFYQPFLGEGEGR